MAIGALAITPSPVSVAPFAMRGVELGVTIDELRAVTPPVDPSFQDVHLVCRQDLESHESNERTDGRIAAGDFLNRAGVTVCEWSGRYVVSSPEAKKTVYDQASAAMPLGNAMITPTFYFVSDGQGAQRLFRIHAEVEMDHWGDLFEPMKAKFGAPSIASGVVQNAYGATATKLTATWDNGVSSIVIEQFCGWKAGWMCIDYHDAKYEDLYRDVLLKMKGDPTSRL